jgi:DNA-binding GntR family transcriptional regulator
MLATREAISHIGPQDLEALRERCAAMERAMERGELLEFGRLNREFHAALYACCPLPRLRQMITELWNQADINRYRAMFDLVPEMAGHAQAEHEQLLHLIETRQVEAAVELVAAHKEYSRQCFLLAFENLKENRGN